MKVLSRGVRDGGMWAGLGMAACGRPTTEFDEVSRWYMAQVREHARASRAASTSSSSSSSSDDDSKGSGGGGTTAMSPDPEHTNARRVERMRNEEYEVEEEDE